MRNRSRVCAIVLVCGILLALSLGAVGSVGADHGEETDEHDIVEVQTVTAEGTETGELRVRYSYHIGDTVEGMEVTIQSGEMPADMDGFEPTAEQDRYEWGESTARPTIEFTVAANQTDERHDGFLSVDTGEWAIIGSNALPQTRIGYTALESDIDDIEVDWVLNADEREGYAGDGLVYLGGYTHHEFDDGIDLIVTESASSVDGPLVNQIGSALERSATQLAVGADDDVTAFVVTEPLRRGGIAVGSDFWIRDDVLPPETVLWHEFTHTQQLYDRTAATEWTIEGGADYYSSLLTLKQGEIEYHEFVDRLERGLAHEDVVLADRSSWIGTDANYELGALALAALDREIREASDQTFEDVFRAKNQQYSTEALTDDSFESLVSTTAGADLSGFFDEYIRSPPPAIQVPTPALYNGPNRDAALSLQASDAGFDSDQSGIRVDIENTGTETSLAPELRVDAPEGVEITLESAGNTELTETPEGWVMDHIDSGESISLTLGVATDSDEEVSVDLAVQDMSGQRASLSYFLESEMTIDASMVLPSEVTAGEPAVLEAESSLDADQIDGYEFTISGPDGEGTIESTDPVIEHVFETAGIYLVDLTVHSTDGQTAAATGELEVMAADGADDTGTTDDEVDDSDPTDDDATDDTDDTVGVSDDSSSPDDALGPGFGGGVVAVALGMLTLVALARRR